MTIIESITFIDTLLNSWAASLGWPAEAMLRLIMAAIVGGLIGLEREVRGREAGFRTNMLVCIGAALTMIVSIRFAYYDWPQERILDESIRIDPSRIAYGVMTGVGFLGAGAIVQNAGSIRGLTTAAAMWCVAAIGLSVGFGLYLLTIMSTILVLGALWILDYFENLLPRVRYRVVTIRTPWRVGAIDETVELFKRAGLKVVDASFQRTGDLQNADISLHVAFTRSNSYYSFERKLEMDSTFQLLSTREI